MAISHKAHSGRTPTGGLIFVPRGKRLFELGREPTLTRVGKRKLMDHRTKGGHRKIKLALTEVANVYDPKKKVFIKATVKIVTANTSNRNFVRRNILTKGAIIDTSAGKAKVTNRPGQEGQVNAILV